jgi:ribosomal protein S18 acetylase RimI-like enzyme
MTPTDLPFVCALADEVHRDYPEAHSVLAERLALFPIGCLGLEDRDARRLVGYCLSHPWTHGAPPKLNTALRALPAAPETYFIHDVAVDADWRGRGLAQTAVSVLLNVARLARLDHVSLVSVSRTQGYWRRLGFAETTDPVVQAAVRKAYADDARHMAQSIGPHFETG